MRTTAKSKARLTITPDMVVRVDPTYPDYDVWWPSAVVRLLG